MAYGIEVQPIVVREGEGRPIWLAHSLYETKLNLGELSSVAVFKMTSRSHTLLAPPHHHAFDEILLVTKGQVVSFTGPERKEHVLNPGDMIFLPAGIVEGFKTLDQDAEMYWFMMGDEGTSEKFFETVGIPTDVHTLPPEEYVSPALGTLMEEGMATQFGVVDGWHADEMDKVYQDKADGKIRK